MKRSVTRRLAKVENISVPALFFSLRLHVQEKTVQVSGARSIALLKDELSKQQVQECPVDDKGSPPLKICSTGLRERFDKEVLLAQASREQRRSY